MVTLNFFFGPTMRQRKTQWMMEREGVGKRVRKEKVTKK